MKPQWTELRSLSHDQFGHFSARQAKELGVYAQLLRYAVQSNKVESVARGVYRFCDHPIEAHGDLIAIWLWTSEEAVFSHETALELHGMPEVNSSRYCLTLPPHWKRRLARRDTPWPITPYFTAVEDEDIVWQEGVPVTRLERALMDFASTTGKLDTAERVVRDAISRGIVTMSSATLALNAIFDRRVRGRKE